MSIPLSGPGDKTGTFDLLVAVNPVWETARLVDRLPFDRPDAIRPVRRVEDGGGSALNTACALACAGNRVLAVGRVGDDPEGRASIAALERRGVTTRIEIVPGHTTKRNTLYVERSSRETAFQVSIPGRSIPAWEEDPADLCDATFLLLDRLGKSSGEWLRRRRRFPQLRNVLTLPTRYRSGPEAARFEESLERIDILQLPEQGEAGGPWDPLDDPRVSRAALHRPSPPPPLTEQEAAAILEHGVGLLVRTRGKDGASIHATGVEPIRLPARATDVVDPTGAGDAFLAGFLDRLLAGGSIAEAADQAVDWAARAVRHLGARSWLDHEPPARH